ncbi:MAG TPA: proprotein convertase P-domain-containing protein [Sedimentisphaerales bacterium]|nr:proprotein convertase P-domain-containing protein [Sedimentisphaerales bacterium]
MDARNALKRIVASAFVLASAVPCCPVYADLVHVYGGTFNLPITDVPGNGIAMTEAIIDIPDDFIISDLDVQINITHTNVFDLQLFLQSPHGSRVLLNAFDPNKDFDAYPNYTHTVFDDEAPLSITEADPPFTGRFRPRGQSLGLYDGRDSYGAWRLQIWDMFDLDTGTLDSFEIIITTPEPATTVLFTLGTALMTLFRPRRDALHPPRNTDCAPARRRYPIHDS